MDRSLPPAGAPAPQSATVPGPSKRDEALAYHAGGRPGKIAVVPTKPLTNQRDLALAYSPGVAEPCLEIRRNPEDAYRYTAKGNLVAVVSNGTAVLGLGNIGALAGKPVMEGKANLFKQFADLDVFDLEVGSEDPDDVVKVLPAPRAHRGRHQPRGHPRARLLLHRGDAAAHDERAGLPRRPARHGHHQRRRAAQRARRWWARRSTRCAWCSRARGAAALATASHYVRLGVRREHITMCDVHGVVYEGRTEG
jgi:malate dehydrogenase (oxaloacetate-decarboxylating)(NADP+)